MGTKHKVKKQVKYLTTDQIRLLINAIVGIRDKIIIKLLLDTGMRIGEFVLMKRDHLLVTESRISIPAENTKTKESRIVRVNRELMNDLIAYCNLKGVKHSYIWKGYKTYAPITTRALRTMVTNYGKKIGLDWLSPHKLRHTHIVQALEKGVPINAVQAQVGHKNLKTTQVYSKLAITQVQDAYDKVGL